MKDIRKVIVLSFLRQFFQTVVRWKRIIYQRYMVKVCGSVLKLYV